MRSEHFFYLSKSVGYHYALVGAEIGLRLDEQQLDQAFAATWKQMRHGKLSQGRAKMTTKIGGGNSSIFFWIKSRHHSMSLTGIISSRSPTNTRRGRRLGALFRSDRCFAKAPTAISTRHRL